MRKLDVISTVATIILVLSITGLVLRRNLFSHNPLGIGLQVAGFVFILWARRTFGARSFHFAASPTGGGLVTGGPYRYVRHPIYSGVLLVVWVGVFSNLSPQTLTLGVIAGAATLARVFSEEYLLFAKYPEYASYAGRTKRLIPFLF